jgi:putative nucleotidyltransferase with HDIG domain
MSKESVVLLSGVMIGIAGCWLYSFAKARKRTKSVPEPNPPGDKAISVSELEKKILIEEELSLLFELSEKIASIRDEYKIAKEIVDAANRFLNANTAALLLVDEDSQALRVRYAFGISLKEAEGYVIRKEESVSGWVWAKNEMAAVNDLAQNTWFKRLNKESYISGAFVSIPLSVQNEVVGVLTVADKKNGGAFKQDDVAFITNVARIAAISFHNLKLYRTLEKSYLDTITTLAVTLDARDPYTQRHSENVTFYAQSIAEAMGLSSRDKELIRHAGLLHDVGKIAVRDSVLLKEGPLSAEEFEQIKQHAPKGEEITKPLGFLQEASSLIRHHHERFDGKGYPDGLSGERIELGARILAVADTFDAMMTDRPYRKALTLEKAVEELIKCKSAQFDPYVVDCFMKALFEKPDIKQHMRRQP